MDLGRLNVGRRIRLLALTKIGDAWNGARGRGVGGGWGWASGGKRVGPMCHRERVISRLSRRATWRRYD